jgi:hypothetical protein
MFFFRSNASRELALLSYLKPHKISYKSEEARKIRKRVQEILSKNKEAKKEPEQFIVALAVLSIKVEEGEEKEKVIKDMITWLCFFSTAVAALFIFGDIRATTYDGAKKVFDERLKKYWGRTA